MSATKTISKQETAKQGGTSSLKMLRAMVGIGVLCALLIVLTYEGTFERIKFLKAEALEKAVFQVLPGAETSKIFRMNEDNTF